MAAFLHFSLFLFVTAQFLSGPIWPVPSHLWQPPDPLPPGSTSLYLDFGSEGHLYTRNNSYINVIEILHTINLDVKEFDYWQWYFLPMKSVPRLEKGYYAEMTTYNGFLLKHDDTKAAMNWGDRGKANKCRNVAGWLAVDALDFEEEKVKYMELRFEMYCDWDVHMYGALRWLASDVYGPKGPASPPIGLWQVPVAVPASRDFLYLQFVQGGEEQRGMVWRHNSILTSP